MSGISMMVKDILTMRPIAEWASTKLTCSKCDEDKDPTEFYVRGSDTGKKKNGKIEHRAGEIIQPCKRCRKAYECKQRRIKREQD